MMVSIKLDVVLKEGYIIQLPDNLPFPEYCGIKIKIISHAKGSMFSILNLQTNKEDKLHISLMENGKLLGIEE